jgi:hypothetical protein
VRDILHLELMEEQIRKILEVLGACDLFDGLITLVLDDIRHHGYNVRFECLLVSLVNIMVLEHSCLDHLEVVNEELLVDRHIWVLNVHQTHRDDTQTPGQNAPH